MRTAPRRIAIGAAAVLVAAAALVSVVLTSAPRDGDIQTSTPATSALPPVAAAVVAPPTRVILTPTAKPATSQAISWLAGDVSHMVGRVQIRASGGEVRTVDARAAGTVNGNPLQHFSATVTGLEAATSYEYRVGLDGSWSRWWQFTTADPTEDDFEFIYYGDAQVGLDSTWPSVVRQAEATAPDAIGSVHAGDLLNRGRDEADWDDWFTGMGDSAAARNVLAAPGNHEYIDDPLLVAWKAHFEYPANSPTVATSGALADLAEGDSDIARQYAAYFQHWGALASDTVYFTDYDDVRFIALNATQDVGFLTPATLPACADEQCPSRNVGELWVRFQAAWLDHVLADSPSKWTVVTFHQPVYSASPGRDEPILRAEWVPILQDREVDLVLMGHDHVYARGYNNDDRTDESGVTDGPVYVVANAGAKHYGLAPEADNAWTMNNATQVRRGAGISTYQVVTVSQNQLVYRSYVAERTADATTRREVGAVFDEFTVTKTDSGRKRVTEGTGGTSR